MLDYIPYLPWTTEFFESNCVSRGINKFVGGTFRLIPGLTQHNTRVLIDHGYRNCQTIAGTKHAGLWPNFCRLGSGGLQQRTSRQSRSFMITRGSLIDPVAQPRWHYPLRDCFARLNML